MQGRSSAVKRAAEAARLRIGLARGGLAGGLRCKGRRAGANATRAHSTTTSGAVRAHCNAGRCPIPSGSGPTFRCRRLKGCGLSTSRAGRCQVLISATVFFFAAPNQMGPLVSSSRLRRGRVGVSETPISATGCQVSAGRRAVFCSRRTRATIATA